MDLKNIIKHDRVSQKQKGGEVPYDAKVFESSLKAHLNSAVGELEWQWDYIKRIALSRKS